MFTCVIRSKLALDRFKTRCAGAKDHRALEWLAEHCHADEFCPPKEQQVNVQVKRGRDALLPGWAIGQPQIRVIEKRVESP